MSGLTPAGQDIKPIFENDAEKEAKKEEFVNEEVVKQQLAAQGSEVAGPVLVEVKKAEEEKKSRGVMDRVKGLWGGGSK